MKIGMMSQDSTVLPIKRTVMGVNWQQWGRGRYILAILRSMLATGRQCKRYKGIKRQYTGQKRQYIGQNGSTEGKKAVHRAKKAV
eukprot:g58088.t1